MKQLKIETAKKLKLESFIYSEQNHDTAIIMCHGFSGSSSGILFPQIAEELAKKYLVCRFDFRGSGSSEGEYYNSSISVELEDLDFVVKYIKKRYSPKNIILLGHSFGCAITFLYAADNKIDAMVSLSGEGDLEKAIKYEFSETQMKDFNEKNEAYYENWSHDGRLDLLGKQFLNDMIKYSTVDAAKKINCPVLFIHGTNDVVIPHIATEEMFELVRGEKKLILMPQTDHMYNGYTDKPKVNEVISYINNWLNENFE